jgi:hypothetical protein
MLRRHGSVDPQGYRGHDPRFLKDGRATLDHSSSKADRGLKLMPGKTMTSESGRRYSEFLNSLIVQSQIYCPALMVSTT